jgi:hypothetical protein
MPVASAAEIFTHLERLTHAFPGKTQSRATLELYAELLVDIPGYVLAKAVEQHIGSSNWFPKVAELRRAAVDVAGTTDFRELLQTLVDDLRGEAVRLEDRFFRQGILDEGEWETLAEQFEDMGREHGAERIRQKLKAYQAIYDRPA